MDAVGRFEFYLQIPHSVSVLVTGIAGLLREKRLSACTEIYIDLLASERASVGVLWMQSYFMSKVLRILWFQTSILDRHSFCRDF